ncbi:hypothetical protein EK904_005446, partial [Melospiza melodia maxima]
ILSQESFSFSGKSSERKVCCCLQQQTAKKSKATIHNTDQQEGINHGCAETSLESEPFNQIGEV